MTIEREEYRPASLGKYCLREMEMEDFTHRAMWEAMERHIREHLGGQPYLPMWLPERPRPVLPQLTDERISSPPLVPK